MSRAHPLSLTIPIRSLNGGLSTQPESLRLPSQATVANNILSTVIEGTKRRPPLEYIGKLSSVSSIAQSFHPIDSLNGKFLISAGDTIAQVYSVDSPGAPLTLLDNTGTLAAGSDFAYLTSANPKDDLRFLTLADYTLVVNRSKTVTRNATLYATNPSQAQVTIVSGAYSRKYAVRVRSGAEDCSVSITTYAADGLPPGGGAINLAAAANSVRGDVIASNLRLLLNDIAGPMAGGARIGTVLTTGWTINSSGSHLLVKKDNGDEITVDIEESSGGDSITLTHKKVSSFTDLPARSHIGWKVQVLGDENDVDFGYWVEFVPQSTGLASGWADGYWREAPAPGISKGMDVSTLPHAFIRQANGEWRFTPLDGHSYTLSGTVYTVPKWSDREAGDLETNPDPAFATKKILGMTFHEGRLGLISEEVLSMSEAREPFSFYRTSVLDVIDSDRIEIKSATPRGDRLTHATPLGDAILLFSDNTQFLITAQDAWTPNTVRSSVVGRFGVRVSGTEPVVVRDEVLAATPQGGFDSVLALRPVGDQRVYLGSADLTASIPGLLEGTEQLVHSPQSDLVLHRSTSGAIRCLSYYWQGAERVQVAWQVWSFNSVATRWLWIHDTDAYVFGTVGGENHLFKLRLDRDLTDGTCPLVHLDRRVRESQCTAVSVAANVTSFTLPFTAPAGARVVDLETAGELQVVEITGSIVRVAGTYTGVDVAIGVPYETRLDPARVRLIDQNQTFVANATIRLNYADLVYTNSGPFNVYVVNEWNTVVAVTPFSGPYLGQGANYQSMRDSSGKLRVGIRSKADDVTLSIRTSSVWPMRVVSMDVSGYTDERPQRRWY